MAISRCWRYIRRRHNSRSTKVAYDSLASVCATNGLVQSGQMRTGAFTNSSFIFLNALAQLSSHTNLEFFLRNEVMGTRMAEKSGIMTQMLEWVNLTLPQLLLGQHEAISVNIIT